jgi:hypothetical protein
MLVGEGQPLFSERAITFGRGLRTKEYVFQARDEEGQDHFRKISRAFPELRFVYVYSWDGWNEFSFGSYLISRGRVRGYRVPLRLVERATRKHGLDDLPDDLSNDEWPLKAEMDAEQELMDVAEAHWKMALTKGMSE